MLTRGAAKVIIGHLDRAAVEDRKSLPTSCWTTYLCIHRHVASQALRAKRQVSQSQKACRTFQVHQFPHVGDHIAS